jgi:hypothetical protein
MSNSSPKVADSELSEFLERNRACERPRPWAEECSTLEEAWAICPTPEPLIWALKRAGFDDPQALRVWARWCVQQVAQLMTDGEPRHALEVAERFIDGGGAEEELNAAAAAVRRLEERGFHGAQAAWAARAALELASLRPVPAARAALEAQVCGTEDRAGLPEVLAAQANKLRETIGPEVIASLVARLRRGDAEQGTFQSDSFGPSPEEAKDKPSDG